MKNMIPVMLHMVVLPLSIGGTQLLAADYMSGQTASDKFTLYYSYSSPTGLITDSVDLPCVTNVGITLDWSAPSITYDSLTLEVDAGGPLTASSIYTVGPGQTCTITTSIVVDELFVGASNVGPLALTPAAGGVYTIERDSTGGIPAHLGGFDSFLLSGSY